MALPSPGSPPRSPGLSRRRARRGIVRSKWWLSAWCIRRSRHHVVPSVARLIRLSSTSVRREPLHRPVADSSARCCRSSGRTSPACRRSEIAGAPGYFLQRHHLGPLRWDVPVRSRLREGAGHRPQGSAGQCHRSESDSSTMTHSPGRTSRRRAALLHRVGGRGSSLSDRTRPHARGLDGVAAPRPDG